jgi:excisionase family DNA binding protein
MNQDLILLTVKEISQLLKVSHNTIYYWVSRSEIPFIRVGKHLRFERDKVLSFFLGKTCLSAVAPLQSGTPDWSLKTRRADLAYSQKE